MNETTTRRPEKAAGQPDPAGNAATESAGSESERAEALNRDVAELKDKLLRTLADMENLRRRTEREIGDARQYGVASFARDMLVVADNMHRALEAVGPELRQTADGNVKALLDGVELTERELLKALEKNGVQRFEPHGEKFDPNLHQAMFEVPDPSVPPGTVAQVIQAGYKIGDRVLRPALVAVAKGGQKAAATEAPVNDNVDAPRGPSE